MNKRIYDEISKFEPFDAKEALDKEGIEIPYPVTKVINK